MKIDMHYYGTYALARAAGLTIEAAETIAYSSEFVDESSSGDHDVIKDGAHIVSETTAHHSSQAVFNFFKQKLDHTNEEQRRIWVPFHFLPAGQGDSFTEKLICQPNSAIAQKMFSSHLTKAKEDYALELIGIAAHVFADTFAHYDFSGVSSRWNEIDGESFNLYGSDDPIQEETKSKVFGKFLKIKNIRAGINELAEDSVGALGHAGAFNYPDIPYLHWSCRRERDDKVLDHNNPQTFLQACRELHGRFLSFAASCSEDYRDLTTRRNFDDIEAKIEEILSFKADTKGRSDRWKQAVKDDELFVGTEPTIKAFDPLDWVDQLKDLLALDTSETVPQSNVYRFYQAARQHRTLVLRDLLPAQSIVVI
ncbi:MAG: hypothetical protein JKY92_08720 [Magnetovibrio sp.]|nr:hypothetical protein [Magnetovibrio sp.]